MLDIFVKLYVFELVFVLSAEIFTYVMIKITLCVNLKQVLQL